MIWCDNFNIEITILQYTDYTMDLNLSFFFQISQYPDILQDFMEDSRLCSQVLGLQKRIDLLESRRSWEMDCLAVEWQGPLDEQDFMLAFEM